MTRSAASFSLAGSQLDEARHVCAFFNSDAEEYRALLPFIRDGFECGHKAIHIVGPNQRLDHLQRLAAGASPSLNELSYVYSDHIPGSSPTPASLKNAIAQTEVRT